MTPTSGEFVNIDNYSVAPAAAAPDMYETVSDTWPDYMETADRENLVGYKSVGVPGALMGWSYAEEKFGRLGSGYGRYSPRFGMQSAGSLPAVTLRTSSE